MITKRLTLAVLFLGLARVAGAQGLAQWNVYVYMNAQPNLDGFALKDLEEMKLAGASPDVNVFVQLALSNQQVRRYLIQPGEARLVDELGAIDPFDSRNLADFVSWAQGQYPARRHCVIVWGHGALLPQGPGARGRLAPTFQRQGVDLHLLDEAGARIRLALGHPVDVWGYDSCFMQRVEVGYELRDAARILVASQDAIDGDGWDYTAWLSLLLDRPSMDGTELALAVTRLSSQSSSGEERNISCVNLTRYRRLAQAVSGLGVELARFSADRGRMASVVTAHYRARRYLGEDGQSSAYLDLGDLAAQFATGEFPPALARAARQVQQAVRAAVMLRFGDPRGSGISIYHQIQPQMSAQYRALDFCRDTSWDEYLSGRSGLQRSQPAAGRLYRARVEEAIPDDDPAGVTSAIPVEAAGSVRSVRLFLNIRHDYVGDLQVVLVAPSGRHAVVLNRVGGNGRNLRGWVDSAEISRLFQGESAQGEWQLRVADLSEHDLGELTSWRLELVLGEPVLSAARPDRPRPAR
jgi:cysteine peptidase C11 family protein/proprotein convertase P-domain-containing protein